jgi:molybdenum cofactor synthesis domain-containing protein
VISVEKALEAVLAHSRPLGKEDVPLAGALGRYLAEDVAADLDIPPFDRAMMDGYAVRAADTAQAPAVLRVVGQVRAGQLPATALGPAEAIQIMTGAPVPAGADAVQQVEKTRALGDGRVEIAESAEPGQNVAPRGCEVRAGTTVLEAGRRVDAAAVAVLATAGRARVRVGRRPRVALLVTGDELVEAASRPTGGQIRNANGPAVLAQIESAGALAVPLGVAPDDSDRIAAAVEPGFDADVLVLSGGVSAGAFDLVEAVLARFGVEVFFERVAIKPGAPLVFGRRGETLVFGLPGNPVSAMVTFDVFVRAALERLQGGRGTPRPLVEVVLEGPAKNRSRRKAYLPAVVRPAGARLVALPLRSAGSADVFAHARANALVVLEADRTEAGSGESAPAMLLHRFVEGGDA